MIVWENSRLRISWKDNAWYIYFIHSGNEYKRFSGIPKIVDSIKKGTGLWK